MRGIESAECIAAREAARIEDCREVAWGSKSFSPRLGILGRSVPLYLGTLVGEIEQQRKEFLREVAEEAEVLCFITEVNVSSICARELRCVFVFVCHC